MPCGGFFTAYVAGSSSGVVFPGPVLEWFCVSCGWSYAEGEKEGGRG